MANANLENEILTTARIAINKWKMLTTLSSTSKVTTFYYQTKIQYLQFVNTTSDSVHSFLTLVIYFKQGLKNAVMCSQPFGGVYCSSGGDPQQACRHFKSQESI